MSAAQLRGLIDRVPAGNVGITSDAVSANPADHVLAGIEVVERSFLKADGIVLNPSDWYTLRALKDQDENYVGGSPFSNTGQGEPGDSLWGKRVIVTSALDQGVALVGAFGTACQLFSRAGLLVEVSNQHDTYFVKDQIGVRAERRVGLAVYRPEALAICDLQTS